MTTPEEDINAALIAAGYSNICAWSWREGAEIFIRPFGGKSIPYIGGADTEIPNLQIQVRATGQTGASVKAAEDKALAIKALLDRNTSVSNSLFIKWNGRALDHWTDQNGRAIFSVEFSIIRR